LLFDVPAKGFVNSLQIISVPPRNVQPDKWISNKARKEQVDLKKAMKKARRLIKRHPNPDKADGDDVEVPMEADGDSADVDADQADAVNGVDEEQDGEDSDEEMDAEDEVAAVSGKKVKSVTAKADPEILLLASLSREPRLGRWEVLKERSIRNGTLVVHLGKQSV
jgi:hypothetical protein